MNTKHAVLYYDTLLWIDGKGFASKPFTLSPSTLMDVAAAAHDSHITHVWVHPTYGEFIPQDHGSIKVFARKINMQEKMFAASVWERGWSKNVVIIFPQYTSWYGEKNSPGWIHGACPHNILITLHYLEQALGVPVGASPGRVGWAYLKKLHPEWLEEIPGIDLKMTCHFTGSASPDIIWQRPLLSIERRKKYVHKFDKNAAYPYAASKTDMGTGIPVHMEGKEADLASIHEKGHPQEVGVWRCTVINAPSFPGMPAPYDRKQGWISGPMVRLLRKTGYQIEVHESWVFPARHDVLVKWGIDLWTMRQQFNTPGAYKSVVGAALAGRAIKQIMNHTIGMTGSSKLVEDDEMRRPDMRVQTIGHHHELTWHNIEKIRVMYGATPIIVYMDALYYLSDEPDGKKALPELMKREGQFGGYKWEGRIELTRDVLATFDTSMSESSKLEVLNKIGWVK